jgi:hypothetical protein
MPITIISLNTLHKLSMSLQTNPWKIFLLLSTETEICQQCKSRSVVCAAIRAMACSQSQAHFCTYFLQLDGAKADGRRRRSKQASNAMELKQTLSTNNIAGFKLLHAWEV